MIKDKVFHKAIKLNEDHIKALTNLAMFLINLTPERYSPLRFRRVIRISDQAIQCCSLGWAREMVINGSLLGTKWIGTGDITLDWDIFCRTNFGMKLNSPLGQYLFSALWSGMSRFDPFTCRTVYDYSKPDNTPVGAGRRILYVLEFGLPSNWKGQLEGHAALSYRVGE